MDSTPGHASARGYAFGPYILDVQRMRVWRDGRRVPLSTKPLAVLLTLLELRHRVVSKDELMDRVWPDAVVHENNLARQIATLRHAFSQTTELTDLHEYIATIPGQGYRFVASAEELDVLPAQRYVPAPSPPDLADPVPGPSSLEAEVEHRTLESSSPVAPTHAVARGFAVAAVVSLAVAGVWTLLPRDARDESSSPVLRRVTFDEAASPRDASWSPDGAWIAYVSDRAGSADIWKHRLGEPDPVQLTRSSDLESQPAWSPDGASIAFRSERDGGGLYVVDADGTNERRLTPFGYEPAWSPDGSAVLFKRSTVIPDLPTNFYVVDRDGGEPRELRPDVVGRFSALRVAWHHTAGRVSLWGTLWGDQTARVFTVPVEAGDSARVSISPSVAAGLERLAPAAFTWSRSGRHVYFEATAEETRNLWRVTVDPATDTWVDGPDRLTIGAGRESDLAISADGSRLLFTSTSSRTGLWAFPVDASAGRITAPPYTVSRGSAGEVDFDADTIGGRLAYRAVRAGRHELWESRISDGQDRLVLSSAAMPILRPVWSPDGARIAFSRRSPGGDAVAVVTLDGARERVLTAPDDVDMQTYDWSRDGGHILGSCRFRRADRYSICLIAADDRADEPDVRVVASHPDLNLFNPRFSPDQRWVLFLAHDLATTATSTVFAVPSRGGEWQPLTEGRWFDDKPRWGPDGRTVYFMSNRGGIANVWARHFDPGTGLPHGDPFQVTHFTGAGFHVTPRTVSMEIAVTRDHLILPMSESRSDVWMLEGADR